MEKIQFMPEGEDHPVDFYVLGGAKLAGRQYLLVTDSEEGEGEALILRTQAEHTVREQKSAPDRETEAAKDRARKSVPGRETEAAKDRARKSAPDQPQGQGDAQYEIVEDETELSAVLLLMRDSLEESGIEIEL